MTRIAKRPIKPLSSLLGTGHHTKCVVADPRQTRTISISECDIQSQVAQFLTLSLPSNALFHHSPNEGKRGFRAQAGLKASGFKAGWPDIEVVWQGRVYFLELKSARGVVSPAQRECHHLLRAAGSPVAVVRSLDEVVQQLREWGVPLRASL